jgi:predicted transcriptional regulator
MTTITIRLNDTEYEQLCTLALVQDRAMTELIREAIREYIQRKAASVEFHTALSRALQETTQLIAELAEH